MPIVIAGDPVLHQPTAPVELEKGTIPSQQLQDLIANMYVTMDAAHGVGLAANQVGHALRLFVYNCPDIDGPGGSRLSEDAIAGHGGPMRRGCVIDPILETSDIPETMPTEDEEEGCLSVPGYSWPTGRADWARVTGLDEHGQPVSIEGYGFFARCLQHECGHLDGFLYTDCLIGRYKRQAKRVFKAAGWDQAGRESGRGLRQTWTPGIDADPFGHDD